MKGFLFLPIVALAIAALMFGPVMAIENENYDFSSTQVAGTTDTVENLAEQPGLVEEVQCVRGCQVAFCAAPVQKDVKQTSAKATQKQPAQKAEAERKVFRLLWRPFTRC